MQIYTPAADEWSAGPRMPVGRGGTGAAAYVDGTFYVMGGEDNSQAYGTVFKLQGGIWDTGPDMLEEVHGMYPAVDPSSGRIFVAGGGLRQGHDVSSLFQILATRAPTTPSPTLSPATTLPTPSLAPTTPSPTPLPAPTTTSPEAMPSPSPSPSPTSGLAMYTISDDSGCTGGHAHHITTVEDCQEAVTTLSISTETSELRVMHGDDQKLPGCYLRRRPSGVNREVVFNPLGDPEDRSLWRQQKFAICSS